MILKWFTSADYETNPQEISNRRPQRTRRVPKRYSYFDTEFDSEMNHKPKARNFGRKCMDGKEKENKRSKHTLMPKITFGKVYALLCKNNLILKIIQKKIVFGTD